MKKTYIAPSVRKSGKLGDLTALSAWSGPIVKQPDAS